MVLWTLSKKASSLDHFLQTRRYVIHVLAAPQLSLAKRFAQGSQTDRFKGLALTRAPGGTLMLDEPECAAWFECYNLTQHDARSEEHTSELQSLMRISYAVFCLKKKNDRATLYTISASALQPCLCIQTAGLR